MRDYIHKDVWVNNGTGGTDVSQKTAFLLAGERPADPLLFFPTRQICGLFIGAVRSKAIYHAELTCIALGMDLQAWDDDGVFPRSSAVRCAGANCC
jgi:acetoacetyl-CoA synthetase